MPREAPNDSLALEEIAIMEEPVCDGGEALTQSAEGRPCKLCLDSNPAAAQTHSFTSCRLLEAAKTLFSTAQVLDEKDFTAFYIVSSHADLDCDPSEDLCATEVEPEPDEPADLCETEEDWPAAEYVFDQTYL